MPAPRSRPIRVTLPASGVLALESTHADNFQMAPSQHPFVELFFVLSGQGVFHLGEQALTATAGDVLIVPAGVSHRIDDVVGQPLSLFVLCLHPRLAQLAASAPLTSQCLSLSIPLQNQLRQEWRRLLFEQTVPQLGSTALIIGRSLQLLGLVLRAQLARQRQSDLRADQRIPAYLAALEHRFFEATDLDAEAATVGISRRRFTQLIRTATGRSWHQHLTHLRIGYARHLLTHTRRSVTAIAFECGYDELSSFYRAFKKHTGTTPTQMR